ncbi:MFS-type transporter [Fulvia fulva]|uniref:MFS-type transporter n=1 Tax=Passalora fulva TaxID=5499 RepID=A0A9Q8P948_PASFU|nr:MFS-type transporter [Fulvia fulva]KAK4624444.1 MFS-type transporter [Fulvia fulva]KAK4625390.1 MFS-type transporter [Fulvia fulva]UJO17672.1 MFS-type transporter [Fulvia fulva]WPV15499.1 MFS-type transporter [Fulvia fulva]WPV30077.1 MFS-type transporter [Fulvia fulva]
MISLISTYYDNRYRPLAVSFAAAGAATGGMVFPAIARQLLGRVGMAWTVRVMGFVFLANSAMALVLVRPPRAARKSVPIFEWSAFAELPYLLYTIGVFLVLWGVYFAYYSITVFATDVLEMSSTQSFYRIMALNGIGIAGRILPAYLVTVAPSVLHVFIPAVLAGGLSLYLWAVVRSSGGLLAWILGCGFCANAVQALFLGGLGSLAVDHQKWARAAVGS